MTGSSIANSPLLYILVGAGLLAIVVYALLCLNKAKKCCLEQGISKEKIKEVITSTISASIVPSLAILIGFLILAASMGSAWPWWRLSVIGALQYETMAAGYTVQGMGVELGSLLSGPAENFTGVMLVMTLGIVVGPIVVALFAKKYSTGLMKAKSGSDWGNIAITCIPLAVVAVYVPMLLFQSVPHAAAFLVSLAVTVLCALLAKKVKVFSNFAIGLSMICGIVAAVLVQNLMK
ncbi:MAG: DUF5058 family protein [Lachnospiraceae bacterium]|nr:DUF5058 family protein [Lachnospiraceae bacterium]